MADKKVKLYGLSTCAYCQAIKKMLVDLEVPHEYVEADTLPENTRELVISELLDLNPGFSFPTTVVGDQVITGFQVQAIKEALGLRTEVDKLYDQLQKTQEPKGYFFNNNRERTFDLLRGLLTNRDRYGYMSCPCRLATGKRELDKDIICPCVYREADVAKYGSCYCSLYVSDAWNKGQIAQASIPERRSMKRG